ncbi:YqgQ family protein [Ornithinibacillus sp. 4-3]|uniref:YqgQ family protein n=1 Tax=Ornithinibacillus sp. 4-3 TaxID=3231488 RepID=A0AB39HJP3_9BACI
MKNMLDVQRLLKRFGAFIYTGDRLGDMELMQEELTELYKSQLIDAEEYQLAKIILMREARQWKAKNEPEN